MLKAQSRLFEQLALASDLLLVGLCWVAAYVLRFYVVGPPLVTPEIPPLRDYLVQLVPILLVWGVAFHWLGLYRPRRLGSRVAEWVDVAKASTLGVLVLIAIMAFVFRHDYEYSRVVILYFWALSIAVLSLWRATFREGLRVARRRGLNRRRAVVVPSARSSPRCGAGPTWASRCSASSAIRATSPRRRPGWESSRTSGPCWTATRSMWSSSPFPIASTADWARSS
jgi:CoA-binding domain